jgi:hypothetical protein
MIGAMPHLSPQTLTTAEQEALLRATASHPRDHFIFSLALGTGMRFAETVGLDVEDVYFSDGNPRVRAGQLPIRVPPSLGPCPSGFPGASIDFAGFGPIFRSQAEELLGANAPGNTWR